MRILFRHLISGSEECGNLRRKIHERITPKKEKKKVMDTIYEHHHYVHFSVLLVLPFSKFRCSRQQFILNYFRPKIEVSHLSETWGKIWFYIAVFRVVDANHRKAVS
jgi:hypothetical protein